MAGATTATKREPEANPGPVVDPQIEEEAAKALAKREAQMLLEAANLKAKQIPKYCFSPEIKTETSVFSFLESKEANLRAPFSTSYVWDRAIQSFDGTGEENFVLDLLELNTRNWYAEYVQANNVFS